MAGGEKGLAMRKASENDGEESLVEMNLGITFFENMHLSLLKKNDMIKRQQEPKVIN